ncbi:hypothetical protein [Bordetella pertussis]|uniref:hypothetical protein n=1 Tax=Bordetella pertussis TaxID=520 RepID=UPI0002E1B3D7|nr:hypothetical protein [Bordetella pertussis]ETH56183.1 hypothetical protein L552_2741 [Bordetella pertussis I002]ETH59245.1 hypothetical protein L553_2663 [Bordetella pertussis I036]
MNWGIGDFQFLKSGSDEPCIQPIESSQLEVLSGFASDCATGWAAHRNGHCRLLGQKSNVAGILRARKKRVTACNPQCLGPRRNA